MSLKPEHPEVSVIIPVHNNADTISEQLDGIHASMVGAPPTEIVVVDNRSSDGLDLVVDRWSTTSGVPVRLVPAMEVAGEPYARNVGIAAARADVILFCDGDDIVGSRWLSAMHAALSRNSYVTGPVLTERLNEPQLAQVRGTAIFDGMPMLYGKVPFAHGCSMGFRRALLEEVGGFDESFLAGCDQEIAIRIWRAGYQLAFCEEATIDYRLRSDNAGLWRQGRNYGRFRVRVRALIDDQIDGRAVRRANLRRVGWLARYSGRAVRDRSVRARWLWVASQLVGEARGALEMARS